MKVSVWFLVFDGLKDLVLFSLPIIIAWQTNDKSWLWLLLVSGLFVIDYGSQEKGE